MPSTHRSRGSGARALAHLGLLLAATALALFCLSALSGDRVHASPPTPPHGDGVHPGGGNGGLDNSAHTLHPNPQPPPPPDPPPDDPPPRDAPPVQQPASGGTNSSGGLGGVAGATASGHSGAHSTSAAGAPTVTVKAH